MKFIINESQSGTRLDKFLVQNLLSFSRAQIQKMIDEGKILLNNKKSKKHYFLKQNDIVEVEIPNLKLEKHQDLFKEIEVVSETDDYIVINKPAGLLVHPTKVSNEKTLVDWILEKYSETKDVYDKQSKEGLIRPGIVHRLDRDVSGLIVIACTQKMFDNLKEQFKKRETAKEYTALVYGRIEPNEGEINRPILRSSKTGLMVAKTDILKKEANLEGVADENSNEQEEIKAKPIGKEAITKFETIQRFKNHTLLKLKLITGRTHQIRVHLRSIGNSIVGDKLYQTKNLKHKKDKFNLNRIFLCATKLGFYDLQKEWQEFTIKLSEDLKDILDGLK